MAHTLYSRRRWLYALTALVWAPVTVVAQFPDFGNLAGEGFGAEPGSPVSIEAQFTPATNDRPALVFVTAEIRAGFHLYALDQQRLPDGGGPQVTTLKLADNPQVRVLGGFQSIEAPHTRIDQVAWKGLELREHEGTVTWFAPVAITEGADVGALSIAGELNGQACNENTCINVTGLDFTARRGPGVELPANVKYYDAPAAAPPAPAAASVGGASQDVSEQAAPRMSPPAGTAQSAPADAAANAGSEAPSPAPQSSTGAYDLSKIQLNAASDGSLTYYLLTALLGGLILNVMPCVLPVIGLKLMSFVQQAGESRRRALTLNLWYSAGIVAVFVALGLLAITLQVGWGDQFGDSTFLIVLTAIVYAMALSLMGLWEIPIPGFVGSGAVMDAAHREGAPAAFLKGVLTTILATPCTGPFMVTGLAWAVKQPPHVTLAVFAAVGVGMASPYLVIGAFPSLMRFLPKPGMWMETFKKAMGLVLLATVVWLASTLDPPLVVPTLALMVGITAACWWIAQTSLTEPLDRRVRAWAQAAALVLLVGAFSYGWFYPEVMHPRYQRQLDAFAQRQSAEDQMRLAQRLNGVKSGAELAQVVDELAANVSASGDEAWQPFTLPKLGRLALVERRTVLVDFTADWCASCKFLEATVLKTDDVSRAIADAGVVTMTADYTKKPGWMSETIKALGGIGVPVIAIFPADRPYRPIVFAAGYTKNGLLEALAEATRGASAQTASRTAAAR